ncbi:MAG TPA: caspase family protein [Rubrivivax sp.]|nr:caspase family protein [Rubrivivax sp.]
MATAKRPKALSLHIGVNLVDPAAYGGWDGPLAACEFDARDMATLARSKGMQPTVLMTKKATRGATLAALRKAWKSLQPGDFYFLTYSGHGGQVPDTNRDEPDRKDETWCLFDGQLIDDELYLELSRFAAGVRIVVLSDSCHSGSVTREGRPPPPPAGQRSKLMPEAVARRVYDENQAFYDQLQADVAKEAARNNNNNSNNSSSTRNDNGDASKPPADPDVALAALAHTGAAAQVASLVGKPKAAVVLISGCQDNQSSMDGEFNGAFTEQLLRVWDKGAFQGNYGSFHARIRARLPGSQSPNLFTLGPAPALAAFVAQVPFTI